MEQLKVLGPVHRDGPLRLFAEPGDDEELSIVGPHDPRALLRHNRPALDQRVSRATWRVDADLWSRQGMNQKRVFFYSLALSWNIHHLSILTSRGDVATALTPGKGENLGGRKYKISFDLCNLRCVNVCLLRVTDI